MWNSEMKDTFLNSKRTRVLQFLMWAAKAIVRSMENSTEVSYKETLRNKERSISVGRKKSKKR